MHVDTSLQIALSMVRSLSSIPGNRESGVHEDTRKHSGATTAADKSILD